MSPRPKDTSKQLSLPGALTMLTPSTSEPGTGTGFQGAGDTEGRVDTDTIRRSAASSASQGTVSGGMLLTVQTPGWGPRIGPFLRSGLVAPVDAHVVDLLALDAGVVDLDVLLALALALAAPRSGHSGVALEHLSAVRPQSQSSGASSMPPASTSSDAASSPADSLNLAWPDPVTWAARVRACRDLVRTVDGAAQGGRARSLAAGEQVGAAKVSHALTPLEHSLAAETQGRDAAFTPVLTAFRPFAHDGELLMTDRFYRTQQRLLGSLNERAALRSAPEGEVPPGPVVQRDGSDLVPTSGIGERPQTESGASLPGWEALFDIGVARDDLNRLFPAQNGTHESETAPRALDRQRLAALSVLRRRLTIVSGGPGTGKTFTVRAALLCFRSQYRAGRGVKTTTAKGQGDDSTFFTCEPRVHVVAPTGKAAVRLAESLASRSDQVTLRADEQAWIDTLQPGTIHGLLGVIPGPVRRFRHDQKNTLLTDLVLVDEASMVDLELMLALLEALPPASHLVLVGDPNQLPSVAAGSVLADLRQGMKGDQVLVASRSDAVFTQLVQAHEGPLDPAIVETLTAPALAYTMVHLTQGHRTAAGGLLATLTASMALYQESEVAKDTLRRQISRSHSSGNSRRGSVQVSSQDALSEDFVGVSEGDDIVMLEHRRLATGPQIAAEALQLAVVSELANVRLALRLAGLGEDVSSLDGGETLRSAMGRQRLLCLHRRGPLGVEGLNELVQQALSQQTGVVPPLRQGRVQFWPGRPVLMTENDPELGLMNGDIGLCTGHLGRDAVLFPIAGTAAHPRWRLRKIRAERLGAHQTCYAMTVHKSQGSELETAILVLPAAGGRLLSREILYTGVTRAKRRLVIAGTPQVFLQGMDTPVRRASALGRWIWG